MKKETRTPASGVLKFIGRVGDIIENILLIIGGIGLLLFFFAVVYDVAARVAHNSVFWAQDTAIFSYFWCVFIAGAICLRRNEHFSIELFNQLPRPVLFIKRLVVIAVLGVFTYYIFRYGWAYAKISWTRKQAASGLRLSYAIIAMPVSGVGFVYFVVEQIILLFTGRNLSEISTKHRNQKTEEAEAS